MEFLRSYFHTPTPKEMTSSLYITWAGHRICTPQHVVGPRILDSYKIVLVTKGRGTFKQLDKEFEIQSGDVFALFPGVKHYYYADPEDPWEIMWVAFNGRQCGDMIAQVNLTPESPVIKGVVTKNAIDIMENIVDEMEDNTEQFLFKVTGNLFILFSELISNARNSEIDTAGHIKQDSIRKAINFIDLNYYNDIDVELLCGHLNISRSHLSRMFKKRVGLTIPEYVNKVRVQRATFLLRNSELNINEIAKSVGFDDQFYFSKIFSRIEGVPPAQYRKAI